MTEFFQSVQDLQVQLGRLEPIVSQANPDALSLQQHFLALQQQFQGQLLGIEGDLTARVQPVLIEMNRTFRLLAMDVAFLQAARQPLTVQQRQRQMCDRIQQLQRFCQELMKFEWRSGSETGD